MSESRGRALLAHLGSDTDIDDIDYCDRGLYGHGWTLTVDSEEWAVMTEGEANSAWDDALDSYLDDSGVMDGIPEGLRHYFDRDKWKEDAKIDGRGHALSSWDGNEADIEDPETGVWFVAFRLN